MEKDDKEILKIQIPLIAFFYNFLVIPNDISLIIKRMCMSYYKISTRQVNK